MKSFQLLATESSFLFYATGIVIVVMLFVLTIRNVPQAKFDKENHKLMLWDSRFLGFFDKLLQPKIEVINLDELAGLQLISYLSNFRRNKYKFDLYELNLVLESGERRFLAKESEHRGLLRDALLIAEFLQLPVWDRSGNYYPEELVDTLPSDSRLQPL